MNSLLLHEFHAQAGAAFVEVNSQEAVEHYGNPLLEYEALRDSTCICDLGFRSRLCLTGADRERFLHGQVTNDVTGLKTGEGCYAALVTAKGKMVSDLNTYRLTHELLLDFEPGLTEKVRTRLEHYIISDDVQVVDVAPHYGLISVQGANASEIMRRLADVELTDLPANAMSFHSSQDRDLGEIYIVNYPRLSTQGFDLFWPSAAVAVLASRLAEVVQSPGARLCGWQAFEMARMEAGIPRFGVDMDETTLPPEAGLESRGISYRKGCYIGQEIINRIRTYGQVAKALRQLRLDRTLTVLPQKGAKLFQHGAEVGFITSARAASRLGANIAFGYVRREANAVGTRLQLRTETGESQVEVVGLPWESLSHSEIPR